MIMLLTRIDTILPIVLPVLIGLTSYLGDVLLYNLKSVSLRAVADNLTHALVGGISWTLIIKLSKKSINRNIWGIVLCFFISSFIDLDHFLLAKSWKLKDVGNLGGQRPILHCTLIPLSIWFIIELNYRLFNYSTSVYYYIWIVITAFLTHHIRDANRRGLWFGFMGSTPPIPYYLYIFIAMGLPLFLYVFIPRDIVKDDTTVYSVIQAV